MTYYFRASSEFVERHLDTRLYDVLFPSLYNLSAIVSDVDGLIGINTAVFITKDVNYTEAGDVFPNTVGFENGRVANPVFSGTMTNQGFNALIASVGKMDVLVDSYNLEEINSPLLVRAIECLPENSNALLAVKVIYMELLSLFVTLSKTDKDYGVNTISIEDLNLIAFNINSLADYLSDLEDAWITKELIEILRDAYRSVKTITLCTNLFKETYAVRYHGIYTGGIEA